MDESLDSISRFYWILARFTTEKEQTFCAWTLNTLAERSAGGESRVNQKVSFIYPQSPPRLKSHPKDRVRAKMSQLPKKAGPTLTSETTPTCSWHRQMTPGQPAGVRQRAPSWAWGTSVGGTRSAFSGRPSDRPVHTGHCLTQLFTRNLAFGHQMPPDQIARRSNPHNFPHFKQKRTNRETQ